MLVSRRLSPPVAKGTRLDAPLQSSGFAPRSVDSAGIDGQLGAVPADVGLGPSSILRTSKSQPCLLYNDTSSCTKYFDTFRYCHASTHRALMQIPASSLQHVGGKLPALACYDLSHDLSQRRMPVTQSGWSDRSSWSSTSIIQPSATDVHIDGKDWPPEGGGHCHTKNGKLKSATKARHCLNVLREMGLKASSVRVGSRRRICNFV